MKRVTKPKGTVAAAVWDYGGGMEMLRAFWDEAVALTPANAAKDERNMPLCRRGNLAALWRDQGLQDIVEEALTIETRFGSFDDFWTPFLEKQGPAGAYAASLSAGGSGNVAAAAAASAPRYRSRQSHRHAGARLGRARCRLEIRSACSTRLS